MPTPADRLLVELAVKNHLITKPEGDACLAELAATPGLEAGAHLVAKNLIKDRHLESLRKKVEKTDIDRTLIMLDDRAQYFFELFPEVEGRAGFRGQQAFLDQHREDYHALQTALELIGTLLQLIKDAPEEVLPLYRRTRELSEALEFWMQASRDKKIWDASISPYRRYHKYFTSLIKKGVDEGSFVEVDPELASRMIVSTAMGLLLQSLLDPKGAKWEKVARDSTALLVDSLLKK